MEKEELLEVREKAIELVEQPAYPNWITEQLPEQPAGARFSEQVLITIEQAGTRFVALDKYDFAHSEWLFYNNETQPKIIGWMPKPEPMQ